MEGVQAAVTQGTAWCELKSVLKWQRHRDGGNLILDTYIDIMSASEKQF